MQNRYRGGHGHLRPDGNSPSLRHFTQRLLLFKMLLLYSLTDGLSSEIY